MIQETTQLLNGNTKINTPKELSSETMRKVRSGLLLLCSCGGTHSGKYEKCSKCMSKDCKNCGISYIKGGRDICNKCIKSRSNRSRL